jgi:uncharacterized membrane protein YkvA (DUF1232 family)
LLEPIDEEYDELPGPELDAGPIPDRLTRLHEDDQRWSKVFNEHRLFKAIREKLDLIWKYLKASHVPATEKALLVAAVVYVISPFDVIPDWAPFTGLVDDLAVVTLIVALVGRRVGTERATTQGNHGNDRSSKGVMR